MQVDIEGKVRCKLIEEYSKFRVTGAACNCKDWESFIRRSEKSFVLPDIRGFHNN